MSFFGFWPRRSGKASSRQASPNQRVAGDKELLGFDLLFHLSYMSSVAASGASRSRIFELAARLPCVSSQYFQEIHLLARRMNLDYSEACRLVGESSKDERVRSLLLRLSASLASGEAEGDFLVQEAQIQAESYGNEYERNLESLKKWTDAYVALIVSATLVVIVAAVSLLIYKVSPGFILMLMGIMIALSGLGVWVIYRTAPKEVKPLRGKEDCRKRRLASTLLKILLPTACLTFAVLTFLWVPLGLSLVAVAIIIAPIGLVGISYDRDVDNMDSEISIFLRSLGNVASATGTTITEALNRLDLRSMHYLESHIRDLQRRLASRLKPELCWHRFVVSTGSEVIARSANCFQDAINLGAEAQEVGSRASLLALKVNLLRSKRLLVSSTFGWLVMAMHGAIIGLLIFVVEVVRIFGQIIQGIDVSKEAMAALPAAGLSGFSATDMELLKWVVIPVALVLSGVNAFAPKATAGGSSLTFFWYLAVTLGITGASLYVVPKMAALIFQMVPSM